ncbi:hypothetical protein [Shewanella sp.]|uniref:hypothetical protein n=1 Tax=Shewanella sp. TaxID=50422 RepID=UPI003565F508
MKEIIYFFMLASLFGCSKATEDVLVATKYWESQQGYNLTALVTTLAEPEQINIFKHLKLDIESFAIAGKDDGGVLVNIKRYCYPEFKVMTSIVEIDGVKKVDSKATIKNLFEVLKSQNEPVRKYCYDFESMELSGEIDGQEWRVKKIDYRVIDWGDKISTSISLHPEECDTEYSGTCKRPKLIISKLNLNGVGGNMNGTENITIHTPPSDNLVISKGSYRVSKIEKGKVRLEISFKHDNKNYLNGFVVLNNET